MAPAPRSSFEIRGKVYTALRKLFFVANFERFVSLCLTKHIIMAIKNYKIVSQEKLSANAAKIPKEWQLPSKYLENVNTNSDLNVLDIPRTCDILNEKEIDITENYDATALLEKMASKQLSSYDVVLAFCKRAAIAHQLVRHSHNVCM